MQNTAAEKRKQVPEGYLVVGVDPHKKEAAAKIARLQSIAEIAKQSQEKVEATKKSLEKLRDINLKTASFRQQAELIARLGIKIYPRSVSE
jgi:hypothetical protein